MPPLHVLSVHTLIISSCLCNITGIPEHNFFLVKFGPVPHRSVEQQFISCTRFWVDSTLIHFVHFWELREVNWEIMFFFPQVINLNCTWCPGFNDFKHCPSPVLPAARTRPLVSSPFPWQQSLLKPGGGGAWPVVLFAVTDSRCFRKRKKYSQAVSYANNGTVCNWRSGL